MNGFTAALLLTGLICIMVYGYRGLTDNAFASRYNPAISRIFMWTSIVFTASAIVLAFLQVMG